MHGQQNIKICKKKGVLCVWLRLILLGRGVGLIREILRVRSPSLYFYPHRTNSVSFVDKSSVRTVYLNNSLARSQHISFHNTLLHLVSSDSWRWKDGLCRRRLQAIACLPACLCVCLSVLIRQRVLLLYATVWLLPFDMPSIYMYIYPLYMYKYMYVYIYTYTCIHTLKHKIYKKTNKSTWLFGSNFTA